MLFISQTAMQQHIVMSVGIGTAFAFPNPLPRFHRADPSTSLDDPSYSIFFEPADVIIARLMCQMRGQAHSTNSGEQVVLDALDPRQVRFGELKVFPGLPGTKQLGGHAAKKSVGIVLGRVCGPGALLDSKIG